MSWITARRRHPAAGYAVVAARARRRRRWSTASLTGSGAATAASAATGTQQDRRGRQALFRRLLELPRPGRPGHRAGAEPDRRRARPRSTSRCRTGRMPAKEVGAENARKPVTFTPQQIDARRLHRLARRRPRDPVRRAGRPRRREPRARPAAVQRRLRAVPRLRRGGRRADLRQVRAAADPATPTQIYEAMLTGPEAMPVFNDSTITPQEKRDIIAYVTQTRIEPNPGGFSLGRIGPVTEGLVVFLGGLVFLVLIALWITAKRRDSETAGPTGTEQNHERHGRGRGRRGRGPVAPHRVIGTPPPSPRLLGRPRWPSTAPRPRSPTTRPPGASRDCRRTTRVIGRQAGRAHRRGLLHARVPRGLRLHRRLRRPRGALGRQGPAVEPGARPLAVTHAAGPRPGRADLGPAADAERRDHRGAARPALDRKDRRRSRSTSRGRGDQPVRQAAAGAAHADLGTLPLVAAPWCCCATSARCRGRACGTRSGARACGCSSTAPTSRSPRPSSARRAA